MLPLISIPIPGSQKILHISTFPVVVVLALIVGFGFALRGARLQGIDAKGRWSVAVCVFIGILAGGRIGYVLVNLPRFLDQPMDVFRIADGLVLYGALLTAIALGMLCARWRSLPLWKTSDVFFLGGLLGLSLAPVACLSVGSDHGRVAPGISVTFPPGKYVPGTSYSWLPMDPERARPDIATLTERPRRLYDGKSWMLKKGAGPDIRYDGYCKRPCPMVVRIVRIDAFQYSTDGGTTFTHDRPIPGETGEFVVPGTKLPWAIRFRRHPLVALAIHYDFLDEWLHPTQIYKSLGALLIFGVLFFLQRTRKRFEGELFCVGIPLYAVLLFVTEFYRGDLDRGILGGLSTSQWVGLPVFIVGIGLYLVLHRRSTRARAREPGSES